MNKLGLFERKNQILVSSRVVAENFEKEHKDVIYTLEGRVSENAAGKTNVRNSGLLTQLRQGGVLHLENYFIQTKYIGENHKEYTEYLCTRDGFTLLAMGFSGDMMAS